MKSVNFPKMFTQSATLFVTEKDATLSNLKTFIASEAKSLECDPYYGINLQTHRFDPNDSVLIDILKNNIYEKIALFFPQLKIRRDDVKIKRTKNLGEISINIRAINQLNYEVENYNLVMNVHSE